MTVQRGELLFQQARYDLAETELRQALGAEPSDAYAHALLALTLAKRQQLAEATEEAGQAIHLAPDFSYAHYALAKVWYERDRYDEARAAIQEAIRLDPDDPDYRFLLSAMHYDERRWQECLQVAEEGLALDAEHGGCSNLRAMALTKLGRASEAGATIDATLARDPQNPAAHANKGWSLLERGNANEALESFREALRLDPQNEWARQGIVEALKARNPIYSVMLRYFLWMSRLTRRQQWAVIAGGYVVSRVTGLMALWAVFVLMTWTAEPFFNLLLRLNRFGRLALSRAQIVESNWIGAMLLVALLSIAAHFAIPGRNEKFLMAGVMFALLVIPLAGTFKAPVGWPRMTMSIYTVVVAGLGLATALTLSLATEMEVNDPSVTLLVAFLLGILLSGWLANWLMMQRVKR
jgi:tetratricopeptide (TPR) repeat protein